MKSKILKTLSVVALLGVGVIGSVACESKSSTEPSTSEQEANEIIASATSVDIGSAIVLRLKKTEEGVKWISSNVKIATVDNEGTVTGVGEGDVTITAMTSEGKLEIKITVTDPEANIRGNIVFDEAKVPSEIVIGDDNAINVEDFVTVTKVKNWTLSSESETIEIDGHKVTGVDYGDFLLTIKAGKTKRAIEGKVVSKGKIKFNNFIDSIDSNFTIMNSITGVEFVDKNFYAVLGNSGENKDDFNFEGSMKGKDGKYYAYTAIARANSNDELEFVKDGFKVTPGRGRSPESYGFAAFNSDGNVGGAKWEEMIDKGEPTGVYLLEAVAIDQYDTNISTLYERLAPGSFYYIENLVKQATQKEVAGIVALLGSDETFAMFYPVAANGQIVQKISYNGQQLSLGMQISDVGTTTVAPVANWMANPVYPEVVDISALTNFFTNMQEKKTFSATAKASWVNSKGEAIDCPSGLKVQGDDGRLTEVLPTFEMESHANADGIYKKITGLNKYYNAGLGTSEDSTSLLFAANGSMYTSSATTADGVETFSDPVQDTESKMTDIWTKSLEVPTAVIINLGDEENPETLLGDASFVSKTVSETDSSTTWIMNHNGEDADINVGGVNYVTGVNAAMMYQTDYLSSLYICFWMGVQGWIYDACTLSFVLSGDGSALTYTLDFLAGEDIHYIATITYSGVGTDAMPEAAKTLIASKKA